MKGVGDDKHALEISFVSSIYTLSTYSYQNIFSPSSVTIENIESTLKTKLSCPLTHYARIDFHCDGTLAQLFNESYQEIIGEKQEMYVFAEHTEKQYY